MNETNRQAAMRLGEKTYAGTLCSFGHDGTRYVGNKACVACERRNRSAARKAKRAEETAYKAAYRKANPAGYAAERAAYRSRRAGVTCDLVAESMTMDQATRLFDAARSCAYCDATDDLHLDHKTPLSRGGLHEYANLQWLCGFHNISKATQTDAEYRERHGIPGALELSFVRLAEAIRASM